jgi:hypothetical protein
MTARSTPPAKAVKKAAPKGRRLYGVFTKRRGTLVAAKLTKRAALKFARNRRSTQFIARGRFVVDP